MLSPSSVAWIDEAMEHARDGDQWIRDRTVAATQALNNLPLYSFGLIDGFGQVIGNPETSAA